MPEYQDKQHEPRKEADETDECYVPPQTVCGPLFAVVHHDALPLLDAGALKKYSYLQRHTKAKCHAARLWGDGKLSGRSREKEWWATEDLNL
jgi:hypothetical protein